MEDHGELAGLSDDDHPQYFLAASTAIFVTSNRIIDTLRPLSGGGNLSADRTLSVDTLALVQSSRTISTVYPLSGGGDLSADRTLSINTQVVITKDEHYYAHNVTNGFGINFENLVVPALITNFGFVSVVMAIDTMHCIPLVVTKSLLVNQIRYFVTSTGTNSVLRIGLYTNSADNIIYPFTAIQTSGVLSGSNLGMGTFNLTQTLSSNQLYWFVMISGTASCGIRRLDERGSYPIYGADSALTDMNGYIFVARGFSNNLPAIVPVGAGTSFFITNPDPVAFGLRTVG